METILSTLTYILFILLALGNLLAFINHCRNLKKIETMAEKLKKLEEEINEKFNVISVDVSVNDNNIKNIKDFVGYKDSFERLQFADYYASIIKDSLNLISGPTKISKILHLYLFQMIYLNPE